MPNYIKWSPVSLSTVLSDFDKLQKQATTPKKLYDYNLKLSNFISPAFNGKHIETLHTNNYKVIAKKSGERYRLDITKNSRTTYEHLTSAQIKKLQEYNKYLSSDAVKKDLNKRNKVFFSIMGVFLILVAILVFLLAKYHLFV